jgi:hypothetical protein
LYQALQRAEAYIKGKDKNQLFQDARWIVNKVFESDKVKDNSNFRLFVGRYFHFFYDQGGAGDRCEDVSFALRYDNRPKLSLALRKKINGLIKGLNDGIKAGVKAASTLIAPSSSMSTSGSVTMFASASLTTTSTIRIGATRYISGYVS